MCAVCLFASHMCVRVCDSVHAGSRKVRVRVCAPAQRYKIHTLGCAILFSRSADTHMGASTHARAHAHMNSLWHRSMAERSPQSSTEASASWWSNAPFRRTLRKSGGYYTMPYHYYRHYSNLRSSVFSGRRVCSSSFTHASERGYATGTALYTPGSMAICYRHFVHREA